MLEQQARVHLVYLTALDRLEQQRRRAERGDVSSTTVIVAVLVALAIAVGAIITARVTARANTIQ